MDEVPCQEVWVPSDPGDIAGAPVSEGVWSAFEHRTQWAFYRPNKHRSANVDRNHERAAKSVISLLV